MDNSPPKTPEIQALAQLIRIAPLTDEQKEAVTIAWLVPLTFARRAAGMLDLEVRSICKLSP